MKYKRVLDSFEARCLQPEKHQNDKMESSIRDRIIPEGPVLRSQCCRHARIRIRIGVLLLSRNAANEIKTLATWEIEGNEVNQPHDFEQDVKPQHPIPPVVALPEKFLRELQKPQRNGKKHEFRDTESVRGVVDAVREGENEDDDGERDVDAQLDAIPPRLAERGVLGEILAIGGDGNEALHPVRREGSTSDVDFFSEANCALADGEGGGFGEAPEGVGADADVRGAGEASRREEEKSAEKGNMSSDLEVIAVFE